MTEIPDDEVEAAAKRLELTHWNGHGCGTDPTSTGACSRCYGPSPADAREVAEEVLAAVRPRWEKQLAEAYRYNAAAHREMMQIETERDAARAELERVRCSAQRIVEDLIEAFAHIVMDTDADRELHSRVIATARNAAAALRPVPEQEQP